MSLVKEWNKQGGTKQAEHIQNLEAVGSTDFRRTHFRQAVNQIQDEQLYPASYVKKAGVSKPSFLITWWVFFGEYIEEVNCRKHAEIFHDQVMEGP